MTDKQKLQQLFEAALKAPAPHNEGIAPQRAFPTPNLDFAPIARPEPAPAVQPEPAPAFQTPPQAQTVFETVEESATPAPTLDNGEADKHGAMPDEGITTKDRRRRIEWWFTLILFLGTTGGTAAWLVQSPARMQATREVIRDCRSYGDIQSMVAKYQERKHFAPSIRIHVGLRQSSEYQ